MEPDVTEAEFDRMFEAGEPVCVNEGLTTVRNPLWVLQVMTGVRGAAEVAVSYGTRVVASPTTPVLAG